MLKWRAINSFVSGFRSLRNKDIVCKVRPTCCNSMRFKSVFGEQCFTEEGLKSAYTHDQQMKVLNVLNEASVEELRRYDLTKTRATNLVRRRTKKGEFNKLDDIFEVENFGLKFIHNLCDSILYGPSEDSKRNITATWQQLSSPMVSEQLKNSIKSFVALNINPQGLMWLHLGRDMDLFEWNHVELPPTTRTYNLKYNLELAHKIVNMLPKAEAYIMERRQLNRRNMSFLSSILGHYQLESMLTVLLNADFTNTNQHRVFTIKDVLVARFFDLKIGSDIVSSQDTAAKILSGVHCDNFRRINCDQSSRDWYNRQDPYVREVLSNCLLQAIVFYELEIVKKKMI